MGKIMCFIVINLFAFFGQLRLKFFQIPWRKIWLRHSVLGCKITTSLIVFSLEGLIRAVKSKNYAVKMCLTSKLNWSNIFCDNCFKSSSFWSISMNLGTGSRKHKLQLQPGYLDSGSSQETQCGQAEQFNISI